MAARRVRRDKAALFSACDGHCQTKFYTACLGTRMRSSFTVFAHESLPRSARFEAENRLYLFALTVPRRQLPVLDRFGRGQRAQKIAEVQASARSSRRTALAAKERRDSRVHLIGPLPSLIHCSRLLEKATTFSAGRLMLVTMQPTRG
jgi:hypothetical protein